MVWAIAIQGSDVYVGGSFTFAGGNPFASYMARWDGFGWQDLGYFFNERVNSIVFYGPDLIAGAGLSAHVVFHVLPNIMGPIIVLLTFQIPANILAESFMSFLGLGLQPPFASWGVLANDGWRTLRSFPHLMISPGVAIFTAMLAFNLLGDGLRDALDPQMRGRM
jgi:hypothetical protein